MNILYHSTGWAGRYIALGYWRAFNSMGHQCELFGDWNTSAGFDEAWEKVGKPDIIWCAESQVHLLPLDRIKNNGIILVVRANWLGPEIPPQYAGQPAICSENVDLILKYANLIEHFACQEFHDKYYKGWRDKGKKTLSLPLAADVEIYQPVYEWPQPTHDVSYCGGYWPNKAIDLDRYIVPLISQYSVKISGWGAWPISMDNIPQEKESEFYQSARIAPCISEPHSKVVKYEILERIFKVLASRAFCISDNALAIPDYFSSSELCVSTSPEDFREKVTYFIGHPEETKPYIQNGYDRVQAEHTYYNRVNTLLESL